MAFNENLEVIKDKLNKQKSILESEGYKVAYICIYGSQNYDLQIYNDEYSSDFDMKAIIVPTLDELVHNSKPVSKTIDTEWGQCDVKDIRTYFQTLLKANPAYIETLFTDYHIIDEKFKVEFDWILSNSNYLVDALKVQFIRAAYGMMCEKEKALTHPYPTIAHKIEKYKYDGKQAHHIYRLLLLMKDYLNGHTLYDSFIPEEKEVQFLIDLKLNKYTLDYVKPLIEEWMNEAKEIRDNLVSSVNESKIDYSIKDEYLKVSQEVIKNKIKNECVKEALSEWLN